MSIRSLRTSQVSDWIKLLSSPSDLGLGQNASTELVEACSV